MRGGVWEGRGGEGVEVTAGRSGGLDECRCMGKD